MKVVLAGIFAIALTAGGCAGGASYPTTQARAPRIDLAELIRVRGYLSDPLVCGKQTQSILMFSRQTGQLLAGVDLVIEPETEISEGLVAAQRPGADKDGYVDMAGQVVIPFQFEYALPFHDGRAVVAVADRQGATLQGIIDRRGNWIVPAGRYWKLESFSEGRCAFCVGDLWGVLDVQGAEIVPARYCNPPHFAQGLAVVCDTKDTWSAIDRDGGTVLTLPAGTLDCHDFHDGRALFAIHSPDDVGILSAPTGPFAKRIYGYLSLTGTTVVAPIYAQAGDFSEGLAPVSENAKLDFRDPEQEDLVVFEDGAKDKWGFIDVAGKVVIPLQFERVGRFCGGLARVRQGDLWGYIDKTGQFVIPPSFDWAGDFHDGLAEVGLDGQIMFINRTGQVVVNTGMPAGTF